MDQTSRASATEAIRVLKKYEQNERFCVLHLAAWKAVCLLQTDNVVGPKSYYENEGVDGRGMEREKG